MLLSILLITTLTISMISDVSAADITISPTTSGGLKQAIETAKSGDTIYLKNGVYSGENNTNITINKNITIKGLGSQVILDGNNKAQFLQIKKVKVFLNNLKFINGQNRINTTDYAGDEIQIGDGGAILSSGYLTINKCTFTNNKAVFSGGAIYSSRSLNITNSIFINNKAVAGGAIESQGILSISKSNFTKNNGTYGGTICSKGILSISKSNFTKNSAGWGGVIDSSGKLTVNGCTLNNNIVEYSGGAIFSDGILTMSKSILNNNKAKWGGAIYFINSSTVKNSTFKNNKASSSGGAILSAGTLKITNTNLKNNIAGKKYNAISKDSGKITKKNVIITPKDGTKVKK